MNNVQSFRLNNQPAGTYVVNGAVGSVFGGSNGGLLGGTYAFAFSATGAGTAQLNVLGPDGVTYIPVGTAISTTTSFQVLQLPLGQYELVITGFTANYASLTRIPN